MFSAKEFITLKSPRLLYFATLLLLLLPNIGLSITEPMTLIERIANVVLPAGLYLLLLSAFRNPARAFWVSFILVFLSAFQMVLLYLFGDSIIAVDMFLNLVTTNTSEVEELLGSLLPAIIGVVVLYVPVIFLAIIKTRRRDYRLTDTFRRTNRHIGWAITVSGAAITAGCYLAPAAKADTPYRVQDLMYPFNVGYNIYLAVERTRLTAQREHNIRNFKFDARSIHQPDSVPEVYVMVIGETARAENFGIFGYERPTTPRLSSISGIVAFPNAFTQSNTTHKSVPMLLSAATADNFDRLYSQRGIISAFREAGFHTAFVSNQRPNHSFIDFLGMEADYCSFLKTQPGADENILDGELAEALDSLLDTTPGPLFVVLHTYGSHFRYNERYPARMAKWTPDGPDEAVESNRQALVNAYDNTILYTDSVLGAIIDRLSSTGACAAMLYASDHGENIFDNSDGLFLHASPRPSEYELHVPMIAWTSPRHRQLYPEATGALLANSNRRILTSVSMFHTMLSLGGIATPILSDSLSAATPAMADVPFHYLSDRNIPVPIDGIKRGKPMK